MNTRFTSIASVIAVTILALAGCATKVENPKANDDQEGADLLSLPGNVQPFKLPVSITNFQGIDPAFQPIIKQMLAVSELATNASATMNQFFSALAEQKLRRNGVKTVEASGQTFVVKSWTTPTEAGHEAGAYFCLKGSAVGYFKWGEPALPVTYIRDLKTELLVGDPQLIKSLDGMLSTVFALDGTLLDANYSGRRRDIETFADEDKKTTMQFVARRNADSRYVFSGSNVDLDDEGTIPAKGDIRAYGNFSEAGVGNVIMHIDGLCPAFNESDVDDPKWCINADIATDKVAISDTSPADGWKAMRTEGVPLPKHELLKFVTLPEGLDCSN
jgi:hypothetical protein